VTKSLTGVLLFVVLFYVYPLKFLWTLLVLQILNGPRGVIATLPDGRVEPMIHDYEVWRLFIVYGLGAAAVFAVFVALYAHAYRLRDKLALDPNEALDTWLSVLSNAGTVVVALLSISLAIVGHLIGSRGVVVCAGYIYTAIGFVEWGIGDYGGRQRKKLNRVIG